MALKKLIYNRKERTNHFHTSTDTNLAPNNKCIFTIQVMFINLIKQNKSKCYFLMSTFLEEEYVANQRTDIQC